MFFNGMEAMAIARPACPDVPFIFVSGTIGEENAVRVLREGATDYVLKSNLRRLPSAVDRAMKDTEERRVRRALEQELRESERRYRVLFHSNPHPTFVYDTESLRILAVNDRAVERYGFSRDEFLAMNMIELQRGQDALQPDASLSRRMQQHVSRHRTLLNVEAASAAIEYDGRPATMMVASVSTQS